MAKMKKVTLKHAVRIFQRTGTGSLVGRTCKILTRGLEIEIGEPEQVCYDHMDKMAVPFRSGKYNGLILCEEIFTSANFSMHAGDWEGLNEPPKR